MANYIDLLAYLKRLKSEGIYPSQEHINTITEFFRQHNTPEFDIYNLFWEDKGLDSDSDNEVLKSFAYKLASIHARIDEEANTEIYDVTIPDYFAEYEDKFEDIYTILIENIHAKENEKLVHVRSDKFNMVGNVLYPRIKNEYTRNVNYSITSNITEINVAGISHTDSDFVNRLKGVYNGVSPFLTSAITNVYYESIYDFSLTVSIEDLKDNEFVFIKTINGDELTFSSNSVKLPTYTRNIVYNKPILVDNSSDSILTTNSYIALYYNNAEDIVLNPRVESRLGGYTLEYRATSDLTTVYYQGIEYIRAILYEYYSKTEYIVSVSTPEGFTSYKLSDDTSVTEGTVVVNGNDLLEDRTKSFSISDDTTDLEVVIKLNSTSSKIEDFALTFLKEG